MPSSAFASASRRALTLPSRSRRASRRSSAGPRSARIGNGAGIAAPHGRVAAQRVSAGPGPSPLQQVGMTLRAVFRLALRQTEGLIGSILHLLGLDLAVPDHSTLSRRAETLEVPRPVSHSEPIHLLVDSTGLRLGGPGEWLIEKHDTRRRRAWRKLHIGVAADTGQILAAELTTSEIDDGSQVEPLLDQIPAPLASFTGDGAYDQAGVYSTVTQRHPDA